MSRPTSFYYAFLALPRAQREAIIAVWDFCRAVDDAVDERAEQDVAGARAAIAEWRLELDRCFAGTPVTPTGRALEPWIRQFALARQPFADLIDGVEMDLDHRRYQTFDDLYEYCWRVASTVGLICIQVFGVPPEEARDYAVNLGVALQLTNILRDVQADLTHGRLYLPLEDLATFSCSEADLAAGRLSAQVRKLLAFEAERARAFYQKARRARPAGRERELVAAEIMASVYRDLLARIERRGYDVFSGRVRVTRRRQAQLAIGVWLRTRLGRDART